MTYPFDTAAALRTAREAAGLKQITLEAKIREACPDHPGRLPCRETLSRIENGRPPLVITWNLIRAVLTRLPELQ